MVGVRAATKADLPALAEIWLELMEQHELTDARFRLSADALNRWKRLASDVMNRADGFLLMAEWDGRAAGFCLGWIARNPPIYAVHEVGFVSELAVRQALRRRGVGRALIEGAKDWFRKRGVTEFHLSTAIWNQDARAFWTAVGGEPLLIRYRFPLAD